MLLALLVSGACKADEAGLCKPVCAEEQRMCRNTAAKVRDHEGESLMSFGEKDRMARNFKDGHVVTNQPVGPSVRNAQERRMTRTRACDDQFMTCTKACSTPSKRSDVLTKQAK